MVLALLWGCSDAEGPPDVAADAAADSAADSMPPVDSATPDGAADSAVADAAADGGGADADASAMDSSALDSAAVDSSAADTSTCVPQSAAAFCTAGSAECGSYTGTDNCGLARSEDCGSCTGPFTCGEGGSTGANECGCAAPPAITGLTVNCASGSARISFTGTTTIYNYGFYASSAGTPPPCAVGWSSYVGTAGFNTTTLPGGPGLGECGMYRICAYEMMCDTDFSPGRLINMCVSAGGTATCSVM